MYTFIRGELSPFLVSSILCLTCFQVSVAETLVSERGAVEKALQQHPRLSALRSSVEASRGAKHQAGLRPNPELSFEIEELRFSEGSDLDTTSTNGGGAVTGRSVESVDNDGLDGAEITVSVAQRIELGRKRTKRIALADQTVRVALWDYEIARADVIADTRLAFLQVLAGQERVALRRQLVEVAETAGKTVHDRVDSGKISPLQGNQADIVLAQARISLASAERQLDGARTLLATQWGTTTTDFERVDGELSTITSLPDRAGLEAALVENPELARWSAEVLRREEAVRLEQSLGKPDVTVSAGWRNAGLADASTSLFDGSGTRTGFERSRYDDSREHSFVIGFSVPLQFFNRNQGRIREAEHRVNEASYRRKAQEVDLSGRTIGLYERLRGVLSEVRTLEEDVVPTAASVYEATQAGFDLGKFPYLNVLNAQRTLFEVHNQHIEALVEYHLGVVELERLLGSNLDEFASAGALEVVE